MKFINLNFVLILLFFNLFDKVNSSRSNDKFIVVLDAGHGGHDSGNTGNGYSEKEIALTITLEIGKMLSKYEDIEVIYTRKTDKYINLFKRAQIANDADADLFISIHCDAFTSSKAFGAGTFVLGLHANERNFEVAKKENSVIFLEDNYEKNYDGFDPNNPESVISLLLMQEEYLEQSIVAATAIQNSFVSYLGRKDRTVKQAGFIVLKYTYMPSVLVETGFLTNKSEGAYLNSSKGQKSMAKSIANAIIDYKKSLNKTIIKSNLNSELSISLEKNERLIKNEISYKIQISAGNNKIEITPHNFNGLNSISRIRNGKIYRYYYGDSKKIKTAKKQLRKAKGKGFKSAFIVAFLNGEIISLNEAKKIE